MSEPEPEEIPDETPAPEGEEPSTATERIIWLLRHRYGGGKPQHDTEWATFAELRNSIGFRAETRYLDFMALNTWAGGKYRAIAFEIKISRSDFTRELKRPEKRAFAEKVAEECFFACPAGLVKPDEVPEGWGLIVATKAGLKVLKHAQQRKVEPWPKDFIYALARRAADPKPRAVPGKIWNYAGRRLDLDELLELCRETFDLELKAAETKGVQKYREEQTYLQKQEHRRLAQVLAPAMGVPVDHVSEWSVNRWLASNARGGLDQTTETQLRHAHTELGRALAACDALRIAQAAQAGPLVEQPPGPPTAITTGEPTCPPPSPEQ